MAEDFDLSTLGTFGPGEFLPTSMKADPAKTETKMASIADQRMAKQLAMASESNLRTVATAQMQGNDLAVNDPIIQDMHTLNYNDLVLKYGPEVADQRFRYTSQYQAVNDLKNAERSTGQVAGDTLLDIGNAAAQTGLGMASLAAMPIDWALGTEGSKHLAEWSQAVQEASISAGSTLRQERNEQHALEASLNSQDNDAAYAEDLANGDGVLWAVTKRLGRDFAGTVQNYLDDPIMMGSLAPVMIGSMIPSTAAIRAVGMTTAISKVAASQGISREAAKKFLQSPAGRKILNAEMLAATTPVIAMTEGGAAANQAQVEILSMSEAELTASGEYNDLRAQGLTHEEAQQKLALSAGTASTLTAGTLALLTSRLGRQFEVNPLKGNGASLAANTGKEALEEGLQEASSQLGTNVGAQTIGLERDLSEGLGSAAAEGVLGGIAGTGTLQAPAAAARTSVDIMRSLGANAVEAVEGLQEKRAKALDEVSAVGSKAQEVAATEAVDAVANLTEANQSTPIDVVDSALFLPQEEATALIEAIPALAAVVENNGGRLDRLSVISAFGSIASHKEADDVTRAVYSVGLLDALNTLRGTGSTDTVTTLQELQKTTPEAADYYAGLENAVNTLESNPDVRAAVSTVESLTSEQIQEIYDIEGLKSEETTPEAKQATIGALTVVSQYNPQALSQADYDILLEQVGGLGSSELLRASLQTAKLIVEDIQTAAEQDALIEEEQKTFVESLNEEELAGANHTIRKTKDDVSREILETENSENALPSLVGHRSRFEQAVAAGRREDAQTSLMELGEFAYAMNNKVGAYNASAAEGLGKPHPYQSYNGASRFFQTEYAPYTNVKSSNSVALAKAAHLEASLLTSTYNNLLENNAQFLGDFHNSVNDGPLVTPELHESIKFSRAPAKAARLEASVEKAKAEKSEPVVEDVVEDNTQAHAPAPEVTGHEAQNETKETEAPQPEAKQDTPNQTEVQQVEEPAVVEESNVVEGVPDEEVQNTLSDVFDGLVKDTNGENKFLKVFRRLKDRSTFLDEENAVEAALGYLGLDTDLNETQKAAYTDILTNALPKFKQAIESMAHTGLMKTRSGQKAHWLRHLKSGKEDVLGYRNALALNFFSKLDKDGAEIDEKFLQAAVIASVEWVVEESGRDIPHRKDEDIAKKLGLPRDAQITSDMSDMVSSGVHVQSALDSITRRMEQLLGVKAGKDHSVKYSQGLLRALSANMVEIMEQADWIQVNNQKTFIPGTKRKYITLSPGSDKYAARVREVLASHPDALTGYFVSEFEKTYHIGTPPMQVADHQIRNPLGLLTKKQKDAIRTLQNTPARFNTQFYNLIGSFGYDNYLQLMGARQLDENKMNVDDLARAKGKNTSLHAGIKAVGAYAERMNGLDEDTPIYFTWNISSVGRLQQTGPVTPQGNKYAREVMTFTNSVLDLQNPEENDLAWLAVAQAMDISLEKQSHADSIQQAKDLVGSISAYRDAVDELKVWDHSGEFDEGGQARLLQSIDQAVDESGDRVDPTDKLLHALLTVARMENAFEQGPDALGSFDFRLGIEADGKTDGPIHAAVNMTANQFTPHQVEVMAKGGMFFSQDNLSLNDYIAEDKKDLYHMAAAIFKQRLIDDLLLADQNPDAKETEAFLRVTRMMNALSDDFLMEATKDGIELSVSRGLVKNPLTVFLYGSGSKGVAGKLLSAAYEKLGKVATEALEQGIPMSQHDLFVQNPELLNDLRFLINQQVFTTKGKVVVKNDIAGSLKEMMRNPKTFRLDGKAHNNLLSAVNQFFAKPMFTAIDEATGGLKGNMEFIQEASQFQAQVFADVFQDMKAKAEEGQEDPLSERQYRDIFEEAQKVAPIYYTDDQAFHISADEKYHSSSSISSSFTESYNSQATLPFPGEASVKVSPYMVIGTGDGQMILNVYTGEVSQFEESLPVFDGIEMSAKTFVSGSTEINKSVLDVWEKENIFEALAQSFDQMERNSGEYAFVNKDDLNAYREQLHELALSSKARKNAMKRMATSVDHMAGANAPHQSDGLAVEDMNQYSPALISQVLNNLYVEELASLRDQTEAHQAKPSTQAADPTLQEAMEEAGVPVDGYGVVEISGQKAIGFMAQRYGLDRSQVKVFWNALKGNQDIDGYRIFLGSPEELNRLKADNFEHLDQTPVEQGQTFAGSEVIFLSHSSPETLLHELVHAHTAKKLINHYADPDKAFGPEADAITRLEGLMDQFLKLDFEAQSLSPAEQVAGQTAQLELLRKADNPAVQMGEFLAWVLANQNLIKVAKDTKVYSPLQKIGRKVLQVLKRLLGIKSYKGDDLFSNVQFNAELFLKASPTPLGSTRFAETDVLMEQVFGRDPRITELKQKFLRKLGTQLNAVANPNIFEDAKMRGDVARQQERAKNAYKFLAANGFHLNLRQQEAFEAVHATLMSGMKLNAAAMRQANRVYGHAIRQMSPDSFLKDPQTATQREQWLAHHKFNTLTKGSGLKDAADGRTDLLATFIALSLTDDSLREILSETDAPKDIKTTERSIDGFLSGWASNLVNSLTHMSITRHELGNNARRQLDVLAGALSEVEGSARSKMEDKILTPGDQLNDFLATQLKEGSEKVSDKLGSLAVGELKKNHTKRSAALRVAQFVTALGSKDSTDGILESWSDVLNRHEGWNTTRSLLSELRGMTPSNKDLYKMINLVKSKVEAVRQDFREGVPDVLAAKFTRKLEQREWEELHLALGKADLSALGRKEAIRVLSAPEDVLALTEPLERSLHDTVPHISGKIIEKAEALARYMITGEVISNNLLRNAEAIAWMFGEPEQSKAAPDAALVETIDKLVSLYAYDLLDGKTKSRMADLAETQADGMRILVGYLHSTRKEEMDRVPSGDLGNVSRFNGWKGYVPTSLAEGQKLIVADDSDFEKLSKAGYTRVGEYYGDRHQKYRGKRGYYLTDVGGKVSFRQGVAQTVHVTWNGVDPKNGQTQSEQVAGMVWGRKAKQIQKAVGTTSDKLVPGEHMMPVFDADGKVSGYELPVAAERLDTLKRDLHLGRMLGVWAGRIIEEKHSKEYNRDLLNTLHKIWNEAAQTGNTDQFVNVADKDLDDPIIRDAWNTIGWQMRHDARQIFGEPDFLPIRRDMVENAIGYRSASLVDPWTGISRWSPEVQESVKKTAEMILGNDAYRYIRMASDGLQDMVSYAKTTIVVRSVIVVWENILANNVHLLSWGMGPVEISKRLKDKFIEVSQYSRNLEEIQRLGVELSAEINDKARAKRLKAQITALEDSNKALSISPLLEAGEFSTISESLTEADLSIRQGKFSEYIEKAVDRLPFEVPDGAKAVVKNALVTKDTALFKGLNRMIQYGDFIAKAALYDHLSEVKKMQNDDIMDIIAEEFVAYNWLPSRTRDGLESFGLTWFYQYILRIMKIALNTARNRPFTALVAGAGLGPAADIDTVFTGSLAGNAVDGSLGYSLGWGMGLNSHTLNPWVNLST